MCYILFCILILDEPTRALDPVAAEENIDLIVNRISNNSSTTLLIATHRLEEVSLLCKRVCVINQGRIVSLNSLSEIGSRNITLAQYYRKCVA